MAKHIQRFGGIIALSSALLLAGPARASGPDSPAGGAGTSPTTQQAAPAPSPDLSPDQVVKLQMQALQANNEKDAGIATAFRFASPENQSATGPLEHFIQLLKSEQYAPMLGCKALHFAPSQIKEGRALIMVTLTSGDGKVLQYLFLLSRQQDGDCKGCWMTDGVQRMEDADPPKRT